MSAAHGLPKAPFERFTPAQDAARAHRSEWVEAVGAELKTHFERRARRYEVLAREASLTPRANNAPEARARVTAEDDAMAGELARALDGAEPPMTGRATRADVLRERIAVRKLSRATSRWHLARARGQRSRVVTVLACGKEDTVEVKCNACGTESERGVRCGSRLLCRACRSALAAMKRARFAVARASLLDAAAAAGFMRERSHLRFSEKLVTFTAPHVGDAANRLRQITNAFPRVMRSIRASVQKRLEHDARTRGLDDEAVRRFVASGMSCFSYLRVYEWTSGRDNLGHPHVHVWLFAPYIDREVLRDLWRAALRNAGFAIRDGDPLLAPDIRRADKNTVAIELIKYLTKDIVDGSGSATFVAPATYASVYEALDGRRLVQGSRGFMQRAGRTSARCGCGAEGWFSVRVQRRPPDNGSSRALATVDAPRDRPLSHDVPLGEPTLGPVNARTERRSRGVENRRSLLRGRGIRPPERDTPLSHQPLAR